MANSLFKKKLDLLTDINMLLLVEKIIREGICHALHWYVKDMICQYDKYMKDYDENKEGS